MMNELEATTKEHWLGRKKKVPLTKSGQKVKAKMEEEYGPGKGEDVFYASMNKGNPGSGKWHEGKRRMGSKSDHRKSEKTRKA